MCRYAMTPYKDHFACFACQKTFKRRLWVDIKKGEKENSPAKCPQCTGSMVSMGKDFESPKQNDDKAWQHLKNLYEVGITFHSCGCTGPGYIPRDKEALLNYFEKIKADYITELTFWRNRIEPETKQERINDEQRNWNKLSTINSKYKTESVKNQEGMDYWLQRIHQIDIKIKTVNLEQL